MAYSLAQAAKAVGRDRSTLLRMIKIGRISASRDEVTGAWVIDPAELHRVYPPVDPPVDPLGDPHADIPGDTQARIPDSTAEVIELRAEIRAANDAMRLRDDTISDLRRRLDEERADRRQALDRLAAAQERITALLTDQRVKSEPVADSVTTRRRWWPWRRR